jgi:hypothetical protein
MDHCFCDGDMNLVLLSVGIGRPSVLRPLMGILLSGHIWDVAWRGQSKFSENNVPQCHCVQHGSHVHYPGLEGRAKLRRLVSDFPLRRPGFEPRSRHVGFVVDEVTLEKVFSEYFDFPCQFSFHHLVHTHYLSCGAGKICQLVADEPSGLSFTPRQEN